MAILTLENLRLQNKKLKNCGNVLKFINTLKLYTQIEFGSLRDLRSQMPANRIIDALDFLANTGMTH